MKRKFPLAAAAAILLLGLTCRLPANEMQRLVFNSSGLIGMIIVLIDNQGVTQENTETIRANLNLAAAQLNQVIAMYQDPPFEVEAITALPPKLERFLQDTEGMNSARRMYYLSGIYSNLKSAMTLAHNSRRGTYYCATCDTFVVDLSFFLGQAFMASRLNDAQTISTARSRINLAISEGIKAGGALGCGFPSWDQWQQLGISRARTPDDWMRIGKGGERLIAAAEGLASAVTIPSSSRPQAGHELVGPYGIKTWVVVTIENGKLVGRQVGPNGPSIPAPPPNDNILFVLNAVPEDGSFLADNPSGRAYRGKWRYSVKYPFEDCFAHVNTTFYNDRERELFSLNLYICTYVQATGGWHMAVNYSKKR
jgi:hypothetical protein